MKRRRIISNESTCALGEFTYIDEDDEDSSKGPKSDSEIVEGLEAVRNEMQSHGDDENWVDEEDDELIEVIDCKEIISLCERLAWSFLVNFGDSELRCSACKIKN